MSALIDALVDAKVKKAGMTVANKPLTETWFDEDAFNPEAWFAARA